MRVAHIIDSLNWGGAQKLQVTFAQAAQARGIPWTIINLRHYPNTPIPAELGALGVRVIDCFAPTMLDPQRVAQLTALLRRERFTVVQTHLLYANILGALTGRLSGTPVVATMHSVGFDPRHDHPAKQWLEAQAIRFAAHRIVAVGYLVADVHRARLGNRAIDIMPNAVMLPPPLAPAQRAALRAQIVGDGARPILISVGRFSPPKAYGDLVTAFAELHKTHPAVALVIAGDGALFEAVAAQVADLGLREHVRLLGARTDVPALLAASDVYVSSSHWEGLPLTTLEAMAAGLPVVATDVGDVARVVTPETGVIVPPREPARLTAALRALLADPGRQRAMGDAARAHVARQYNVDAWFERYMALYRAVGRKS